MTDCVLWINSNVSLWKKAKENHRPNLTKLKKSVINLSKSPNPWVTKTLVRTKFLKYASVITFWMLSF